MAKHLIIFLLLMIAGKLAAASLELYGTFHAMGIIVSIDVSDDPDHDASAAVEYRLSGENFSPGLPLARVADNRFVGSLFWLNSSSSYDVRITFSDPDGDPINGLILFSTQSTQNEPTNPTANHSFYVSPDGEGSACSEGFPCLLDEALSLVQPGDEIILLDGIYYEGEIDFPRSGSIGNPIVLKGNEGINVVFEGGDPDAFTWSPFGGGVYVTTVNEPDPHLVLADDERLYPYQSLADLQNLVWDIPGFYADGITLYVRLENDTDPNSSEMIISRYNYCFYLEQDYIIFQNLTFQHFGCGSWAKALYFNNANYNLVQNCTFAVNDLGIGFKRDSHRNIIQDNEFFDTNFDWPWDAVKSGSELETGGVRCYDPMTGRGNVIRRNVFHDYFDGFGTSPGSTAGLTNETDVYENTVYRAGDDGVEVDGQASNVRLWSNTFYDILMGISVAPVYTGPVYILYNTIYNTGAGNNSYSGSPFKFNSGYDQSGTIFLFHNTCSAQYANNNGLYIKAPGSWNLIVSRNNIWDGTDYSIENYNTSQPTDFDYDCLWTTSSGLVRWNSVVYQTIDDFQSATDQETSGIESDPLFADPAAGNFELLPSSDLVDAGLYIPGINDFYVGAAPDIGAKENLQTSAVLLSVKIWLEGAYKVDRMLTTLNEKGVIPLTSPYASAPRTKSLIPHDVVDWILLELRSTPDGIADFSGSYFLQKDGMIVDIDGVTNELALAGVGEGDYYIVIKHRNHLAAMSAFPVNLNQSSVTFYDFSTSGESFYGTEGGKQLLVNVWGMWGSNANDDFHVDETDYAAWILDALVGESGYLLSDFNMDGKVTSLDYVLWYNNQLAGASSGIP